jgi:hypothetical protein
MEGKVKDLKVFDNQCTGCLRFKSDIMLTIRLEDERNAMPDFNDFFLSTEQAKELIVELQKKLKQNEQN